MHIASTPGGRMGRLAGATSREFNRVATAIAGVVMLMPVYHLEPGASRQICAAFAGVLLVVAVWPRRRVDLPATTTDLVELEVVILRTREDVEVIGDRIEGITGLVGEIRDQVR